MAIVDIGFVDGLNHLYKPNSVDHKTLLLAASDGGRRASMMPFTSWFILPADPQGWCFAMYILTRNYSHSLVKQTGQFTINVPRRGMEDAVKYCGSVSGRDHDKFEELGLTKVAARFVSAPMIGECSVHFECKTQRTYPFMVTSPGHEKKGAQTTVFEAQILAMHAQEDIARQINDTV